jgi:4-hydroxybutyryl-CoA dehydratase/vinylacetyl-CoA-Delta-isomerase
MAIRTVEEYKKSIQDDRVVYFHGEKIQDVTKHPIFRITLSQMALDYFIVQDPKYRDLFVDRSESGEETRFLHRPERSVEDLNRRRKIVQLLARIGFGIPGGSNTTGKDALNAIAVVCDRMDRLTGSRYRERVEKYRRHLLKNDPAVIGAVTDMKGDRSLRPSKQVPHQDYYVRVVDRTKDGIVVRGAKAHISLAPCANEMIVIPCRRHLEEDKDYAVVFAIPVNAKGITMITTDCETTDIENTFDHPYSSSIFFADAIVIFDDVFIPNESVFMDGEWKFSGHMAYAFANSHRLFADSYKYVELEILAGAAALIAEYNGLEKIPHIQDKLSWLTMYCEAEEALAEQACVKCVSDPGSDLVYPNPMYSNIAKYFFADNYHLAMKHVQDIAGGLVCTIPSSKDFFNPETRPLMEKYLGGKAGIPTEHRLRAFRLIKDLTSSWHSTLTIHGEGSLATQRMSILALADLERYKAAARRVARIKVEDEHPLYRDLPEYPLKDI